MDDDADADVDKAIAKAETKAAVPMILVILLGVNLVVTCSVAAKVFFASDPVVVATEGEGEDAEQSEEPGPVHPLDSFVVNLNEPGSARYLKTTFNLELADKAAVKEAVARNLAIRDQVLRYLSSLTVEDTLGVDGKDKIQEGIITKLEDTLGEDRIRGLFFIEFVVQ